MRPSPSALAIPPQSGKGVRESGWRLGRGERLAENVHGHFSYSVTRWQDASHDSSSQVKIASPCRKFQQSEPLGHAAMM